jgi:hypothetical protein
MVGSLMVLRPDEPILYYYDRATSKDSMRDMQFVTLVKAYRLLWIAVVLLGAIALPAIREYLFILLSLRVLYCATFSGVSGRHARSVRADTGAIASCTAARKRDGIVVFPTEGETTRLL